jgi:predicted Zn-dependent protease
MSSRLEHFRSLAARQPENPLFRFSLAQALEAEGHAEEALGHHRFCAAAKEDWMMPRILAGKILARLGRKAEAKTVLEEALNLAVAQTHEEPEQELRALLAEIG